MQNEKTKSFFVFIQRLYKNIFENYGYPIDTDPVNVLLNKGKV